MVSAALDFTLLLDLGIIVMAATFVAFIAKHFKQPYVLAYLIAGMLIGPAALEIFQIGIPASRLENIKILSELGVAFLLFYIGVETDFSKVKNLRKIVFLGGFFHIAMIFLLSFVFISLLGFPFFQGFVISAMLSFSSTVLIVKTLSDKRELHSLSGRIMVGFLLIEDVVAVMLLSVIPTLATTFDLNEIFTIASSIFFLFLLAYLMHKKLFSILMKHIATSAELLYLTSLSTCFLFIALSFSLKLPISVGAFIGGLSLSGLPQSFEMIKNIRGLRDFFVTIFFVTLGMQLHFRLVAFPLEALLAILFIIYVIKPLVFFATVFFAGYGSRMAIEIAMSLAQVSEFSFIILNQVFNLHIIDEALFALLATTITLSMLTTPYFMSYHRKVSSFFNKYFGPPLYKFRERYLFFITNRLAGLQRWPKEKIDIVLFGCGILGGSIVEKLYKNYNIFVIDNDPDVVARLHSKGINAVCASADNKEVLEQIELEKVKLFFITVPNFKIALSLSTYIKNNNPDAIVFARAHYFKEALRLYENGVDLVFMPEVVASNLAVKYIIEALTKKRKTLFGLREEFLNYIREKAAEEEKHFKV